MPDRRPRILLVDDEDFIREAFGQLIEEAGFFVETAMNVATAQQSLSSADFDAVLLDILLKGASGIEVLKHNRRIQPDTPVIMMTGEPTVKTASEALRLGAYDYLCKPVDPRELVDLLESAVALKAQRTRKRRNKAKNLFYRKKLEAQAADRAKRLQISEDRYRSLFESSKDAIYFSSVEGRFLDFNQAAVDLFGYPRDRLMAMDLGALYVDLAERERMKKAIDKDGFIKDFEIQYRSRSGAIIDCVETATPVMDAAGRIGGYQGIIHDVTAYKEASQKLWQQIGFLSQVLESLAHPFLVVDAVTSRIIMANSAAVLAGEQSELLCHQLFHGLDQPCSVTGLTCPIDEVVRTRRPVRLEHEHRYPEEGLRICEIHGFPLMDDDGSVDKVILYHLDISERVKAKQELQLLETAIRQTADGVIITDTEGQIQYVNPGFEALSGYGRQAIDGFNVTDLQTKLDEQPAISQLQAMVRQGDAWKGHIKGEKKDGALFNAEVSVSPVKDTQGQVLNFVGICRDVTEKQRLESIAEAANLMDNLGFIFAGIRHEIGNPLNSIKVALTVLLKNLDTYPKQRVAEFLQRSLAETARVEYLLKALRNFSMFEHPDIQKIDINTFLEQFLPLVTQDFERRSIRITAEIDADNGWAYTDTRALHQVLLNLLTNAADALEGVADPQIAVTVNRSDGLVQLQVKDNGQGMSSEQLQNLFKPFFTSKQHGTGLGLVIVKKMLAAMGCSIKVESAQARGTTVTILIPGEAHA